MTLDMNLTDGRLHRVALYFLDWDSGNQRAQRIDVLDAVTGVVLDTRAMTAFQNGKYGVWDFSGHVAIRVTATNAQTAALSGIFFGDATGSPWLYTTRGTSKAWLASYYAIVGDYESMDVSDLDGDGMTAWQEYLAGTNPNDAGSVLKLLNEQTGTNNTISLMWSSQLNKWYAIDSSTNLSSAFNPLVTHIPGSYPINTQTVNVGSAKSGFFKIRLEQ